MAFSIEIDGIINTIPFQKAKWCAIMLQDRLPWTFTNVKINDMFQMQWCDFLEKTRRNIGGRIWLLDRPVTVFINGHYIGSDIDLINWISEIYVMCLPNDPKFYENLIVANLKKIIRNPRKFVFFTFSVNGVTIGSWLFMLYSDLLPQTCNHFLNLCVKNAKILPEKLKCTNINSAVHKIVKDQWLQLNIGIDEKNIDINEWNITTKSYGIYHDRPGVLSLVNDEVGGVRLEFFVCLNPNPWMNGKYLAFGQLVDGVKTLKKIKEMPTHNEVLTQKIIIIRCGEYSFDEESQLETNADT